MCVPAQAWSPLWSVGHFVFNLQPYTSLPHIYVLLPISDGESGGSKHMLLWMEYQPCLESKNTVDLFWTYGRAVQPLVPLFAHTFLQSDAELLADVHASERTECKDVCRTVNTFKFTQRQSWWQTHLDVPLLQTLMWTWKSLLPADRSFYSTGPSSQRESVRIRFSGGKVFVSSHQQGVQRAVKAALYSCWRNEEGDPTALQPT